MEILWHGTASLTVRSKQTAILIDPYLPLKGSPVPTDAASFDGVSSVLITHAHIDHVSSLPVLSRRLPRTVYGTQAVVDALRAIGGLEHGKVRQITPGQHFSIGDIEVTAFQGQHIRFDRRLVLRTLLNANMLRYASNLPHILPTHLRCKEKEETVGYLLRAEGRQVFVLGSLGLDPKISYPTQMDLLVLPYQGSSQLLSPAMAIIDRLQPNAVLLDHFDNTFPPLSQQIDTSEIINALRGRISITKPEYHVPYTVSR